LKELTFSTNFQGPNLPNAPIGELIVNAKDAGRNGAVLPFTRGLHFAPKRPRGPEETPPLGG